MQKHIIILGGGYGGLIAALRLRKEATSTRARVTLIDASAHFQQRIRNHQAAAGDTPTSPRYTDLLRGTGIQFVQARATQIQPAANSLHIQMLDGATQTLPYDTLIYGLGSYTDTHTVTGATEHALTLDNRHKAALRERLQAANAQGGRCIIVGAGLTGIESAAEFAERYPQLSLTVITHAPLGTSLSQQGSAYLRRAFAARKITVIEGQRVTAVNAASVTLQDGSQLPCDVCIWAASFSALPLAQQSGFAVNEQGQMLINAQMQSVSHANVFGVGDAAAFAPAALDDGLNIRMACATAMPMGTHAADNVIAQLHGKALQPFRFMYIFRCISLGRKDALIQWVTPTDTPRERIMHGRLGVFTKEFICRFTLWAMYMERHWHGSYNLPKPAPKAAKDAHTHGQHYKHI